MPRAKRKPQSGAARMKTTPIQFRVTAAERAALQDAARERRVSLSELIRTDLLAPLVGGKR